MRSQSKRQTCLQQAGAFRPTGGERSAKARAPSMSPTDEAINPNRQTGSQRKERSTPTVRRVSSDRGDQLPTTGRVSCGRRAYHSNPPDWTEDEGLSQLRRCGPALPAKDQRQLRFGSIPSWETGGERIILRSCPCNRDHAPRFLWSETLEKAKQRSHYRPARRLDERACRPPSADCRQSVHKS